MARRSVDHLLIGGGLASAHCANTLREEGADGSILLVGREPDPPYSRPPLSKGYLQGEKTREDGLFRPDEWWEEQEVELLTRTSVMKLDPSERVAKLSNKEEVEFGKALLATGSNVRRLRADGADLDGIHYLRTFGNSDAIRADAENAERAVTIGGSFIGTEVAASLAAGFGLDCSIVMMEDATHEREFGQELGGFFQGVLEEHGVDVHGGQSLARFEGSDGRVRKVVTESGLELECDFVVIGVGVIPDVLVAKPAGLELGERGGVRCSAKLESSAPGIWAAGDICEYDSVVTGGPLRVEHWDTAVTQGQAVAKNMLGRGEDYRGVPYFFSDLADWASLGYLGTGSADPVVRGSLDDGEFTAFFREEGRVTAALSVGRDDDLDHARRMIEEHAEPDEAALADPDTDLSGL